MYFEAEHVLNRKQNTQKQFCQHGQHDQMLKTNIRRKLYTCISKKKPQSNYSKPGSPCSLS